ncbi:sigma-70 family RNA polymerase sigma factor [Candidatus Poribacteria bacterium]|nr:sigma-70 family RNA polymerase sigma factor [Candidatus Poribacteria bacterium]
MEMTDYQLIKQTLSGNQDAFTVLVQRYQKRVHALAWRKIGDFHIAEEITQDTFLRAYRKLNTLKNPQLFAGWLYVIANRMCDTLLRKSPQEMQSLETIPIVKLEEQLYSDYATAQREERVSEKRVALVKRLLQKLPESERIVVTLHYLADSPIKEISEFLGVSLNTVKSRLHRARRRLAKEDRMVRETLGGYQPSADLTQNIVRTIKETGIQIDPSSSGGRPVVPWIITTSTFLLVALMLGFGSQRRAVFQQPYNLEATSEMSIDIVDASVFSNLPSDPNVKNQIGTVDAADESVDKSDKQNNKESYSASGHIIDEKGNPVDDVKIAIMPVEEGIGAWFPKASAESFFPNDPLAYPAEINTDGSFHIPILYTEPVLLGVLPYFDPDSEIIKIKTKGMTFYSLGGRAIHRGIVFAAKTREQLNSIEVTVRQFIEVKGTVLQVDGTPVANERIDFKVKHLGLDSLEGRDSWGQKTDNDGNFVQVINHQLDGFYIMSIEYKAQRVILKPIIVKLNDRFHEVTFNLTEPILPNAPENPLFKANVSAHSRIDARDVWVVNPANGHAYKKISCLSPEDAIIQAKDEEAYLVTINDEEEQEWISMVFNPIRLLIGLTDIEEEGQWQWQNGDTSEYTNWAKHEPDDVDNGDEDYVILTGQEWEDIGPENIRWSWMQTALIEKKGGTFE